MLVVLLVIGANTARTSAIVPMAALGRNHSGEVNGSADAVLARRVANTSLTEHFLRNNIYSAPPNVSQRVRIIGVTDRRDLNGRFGMAEPVQPKTGKRLVKLEDGKGASISLKPANLELAPPMPEPAVYNRGTGGYEAKRYGNSSLPRRCKTGSGRPSYSTRNPPPEYSAPVTPPLAGVLLPKNDAPAEFVEAFTDGSLPVRVAGAAESGELRWLDPMTGGEVPRSHVDARRWLPLLFAGLRDPNPAGAYVALRGALELVGTCSRRGVLPPLMPSVVPSLKAALDLRERSCVCAALRLLTLLLQAEPRAGLALRPYYKQLLPTLGAYKTCGRQPSLGDELEYSQHRHINVESLIDDCLHEMERCGGPGAGDLVKSFVPTFQPAHVELHRGFR